MKYWDNKGAYQAEYNELVENYMPMSGPAANLSGEVIRAVSKIYHDAYNNGFLNNTSGAWNFLYTYVQTEKMHDALETLKPCVNTGDYSDFEDIQIQEALDTMADEGILFALKEENLNARNPCDMLDLSDQDVYSYEDEEEFWY